MDRVFIQGSLLPLQRNEAIQRMRGKFIVFIDDDMTWPPDALTRLIDSWYELEHMFDEPIIVGGLCYRRTPPYVPTMYMRKGPTDGGYRFLEKWDEGFVEVDATGCAFLLIPVLALETIAGTEQPPYEVRMNSAPPSFFRWERRMGEDLRFCQDFKAKGGKIFVDTRVKTGHMAEIEIGHEHFLTEIARRSPTDEARVRVLNSMMDLPTLTATEARKELGW